MPEAANETVLSDYPEGFDKALAMLEHVAEEKRAAYLRAFIHVIMTN